MPRKKGTPKTGGRQPGTLNRATGEAHEIRRQLIDDPTYQGQLQERLRAGRLAPAVETMLWHYAVGKPKDHVEPWVTVEQVFRVFDGVIDAVRSEVTDPVVQRRIDQAVLRVLRPIGPLPSATERLALPTRADSP